jgi:hypothetical protein
LLLNGTSQFMKVNAAAAITPVGPGSGSAPVEADGF